MTTLHLNIKAFAQSVESDQYVVSKTSVIGKENLSQVFFLNESEGWVLGNKFLYKTLNKGKTWEKIQISNKSSEVPVRIWFLDSKNGWLILQKTANVDDERNYFKVLKTSNGGITWKTRYEENNGIVTNILFKDNEGWLAGYHKRGLSSIGYTYLLLNTTDNGETWEDKSSDIEKAIAENDIPKTESERKLSRNAVFDIEANESSVFIFLKKEIILKKTNSLKWNKTDLNTGQKVIDI
jgi:photosystem II stability/assembly factor-like uncharacterized protein